MEQHNRPQEARDYDQETRDDDARKRRTARSNRNFLDAASESPNRAQKQAGRSAKYLKILNAGLERYLDLFGFMYVYLVWFGFICQNLALLDTI